jgi:hypothetical protein
MGSIEQTKQSIINKDTVANDDVSNSDGSIFGSNKTYIVNLDSTTFLKIKDELLKYLKISDIKVTVPREEEGIGTLSLVVSLVLSDDKKMITKQKEDIRNFLNSIDSRYGKYTEALFEHGFKDPKSLSQLSNENNPAKLLAGHLKLIRHVAIKKYIDL